MITVVAADDCVSDGNSDGSTKPRLVCFGFGGGEVAFAVKLGSSIGPALCCGKDTDGSAEQGEATCETCGWLWHDLPEFSLKEAGGPHHGFEGACELREF